MNHFVVGDVHGCFDKLQELLNIHWDKKEERLILLGDLVDRGKNSREVIQLMMKLKEEHNAIILKGNHEDLFLDWLSDPYELDYYYNIGGRETVDSFFEEKLSFQLAPHLLAERLRKEYPAEMEFLAGLPNYHEHENHIFVHAGVNLAYENWRNSSDNDFKWIRDMFIYAKNETGKTIVFGHTVTRDINESKSDDVWFSPCGTKIGLDGACVFGGYLHGLKIKNGKYEVCSV